MFAVSVRKAEEVIETIARQVQERGVRDAALTLIGAVQECA